MSHPVSWFEIQVPDLDVARKFYGEIFGWTFQSFDGMDGYEIILVGEKMYGALQRTDGDVSGRHVNVVFDADTRGDHTLEDLLASVRSAGGTVVTERTLIAEGMGWYATATDPSGLRMDLSTNRPAA